tara:strand:+ start:1003 stop:1467 length:465 start_codon:yes stop_codon:yes gene_type:complete
MQKSLHEIFTEIDKVTSVSKKAEILKDNESDGLKIVLRGAFDTGIQWLVPDSKPPFEPNDAPAYDLADMKLQLEAKKIGRFATFNGNPTAQGKDLSKTRREQLFIQLLEGLHITEAEILLTMVKKKLNYKGLTAKLSNKAFPDLIPVERMVKPK